MVSKPDDGFSIFISTSGATMPHAVKLKTNKNRLIRLVIIVCINELNSLLSNQFHTSKKHGNRQADGGGQVHYTGSLTEKVCEGYRKCVSPYGRPSSGDPDPIPRRLRPISQNTSACFLELPLT